MNFTEIEKNAAGIFESRVNQLLQDPRSKGAPPDFVNGEVEKIMLLVLLDQRMERLRDLSAKTGRNTIAYYSAWQQSFSLSPNPELMILDNDMNGFMNSINKMDRVLGLDLVLHTPGGVVSATESIVSYLRKMFKGNIRVIVPHMAMSAGTMIACAANEIIMGKQSSLGAIDPQFGNLPAEGVIDEFKRAVKETVEVPNKSLIWKEIIQQYKPTFIGECENVIALSNKLVTGWLESGMFKGFKDKAVRSKNVVSELASHKKTYVHDRHYDYDKCKSIGLKVRQLEKDQVLQDLVLSLHHTYTLSVFKMPRVLKFIESQNGQSFVNFGKR